MINTMNRNQIVKEHGRLYCACRRVWCAYTNLENGTCNKKSPCRVGTPEYIAEQEAREQLRRARRKRQEEQEEFLSEEVHGQIEEL